MTEEVKESPEVLIGGKVEDQPAAGAYAGSDPHFNRFMKRVISQPEIGAYSAATGQRFSRDIEHKTPYALSDKSQKSVMDSNNRWLKELGITSTTPLDFEKAWQTDTQRQRKSEYEWRDTYGGKLAIRSFSRGILGSVFFTAGQHIAGVKLSEYSFNRLHPERNTEVSLSNPIAYAARLIDKTLGEGYYRAALVIHKGDKVKANQAVTFRDTNSYSKYGLDAATGKPVAGRSFGHEGMAITFDFGMASLGDYLGRELAGLIDPNTEKKWMKDGHIDVPQATKALLKSMWTGTTKSMGEDYFAMAAGYPFVVRGSRNLVDKFSPGFKYDSDRAANGGSFKVGDDGKIVGNYQLEGMTDLGLRFTSYNVLTKIYRDGYDKVASKMKHFWDGDRTIHMPHFDDPSPSNILKKTVEGVHDTMKYLARTVVKVAVIMIPSSSVFAFIRSSQSKDLGLAIHPEHGPVEVDRGDGQRSPFFTSGAVKSSDGKRIASTNRGGTEFYYRDGTKANFDAFIPKREGYERRFDPYGQNVAPLDGATNVVGRFCHNAGHTFTEALKPLAKTAGIKDMGAVSKHAQRYMDATLAYTPYFMVKTDLLSTAYDTPRMDMAVDRMLSGAGHLNFKEFKAGSSEVLHTILDRPFVDPDREKFAQKKMSTYANQLWSSQDEILAKEREEEYRERMDAQLSLGKPISMKELYRRPFTERVGRKADATNDSYYAQNISPITPKKPEDYKKPEGQTWKKQANGSWHDRTMQEFQNSTDTQGQAIH